jgi:hypothetical protein
MMLLTLALTVPLRMALLMVWSLLLLLLSLMQLLMSHNAGAGSGGTCERQSVLVAQSTCTRQGRPGHLHHDSRCHRRHCDRHLQLALLNQK